MKVVYSGICRLLKVKKKKRKEFQEKKQVYSLFKVCEHHKQISTSHHCFRDILILQSAQIKLTICMAKCGRMKLLTILQRI